MLVETVHVHIFYVTSEQYIQRSCCRNFQEIEDDYDNLLINKNVMLFEDIRNWDSYTTSVVGVFVFSGLGK